MPVQQNNQSFLQWVPRESAKWLGVTSAFALLLNWSAMVYFSTPYGSHHFWPLIEEHSIIKFGGLMMVGAASGVIAAMRHSLAWLIPAALNVISYVMELMVS